MVPALLELESSRGNNNKLTNKLRLFLIVVIGAVKRMWGGNGRDSLGGGQESDI